MKSQYLFLIIFLVLFSLLGFNRIDAQRSFKIGKMESLFGCTNVKTLEMGEGSLSFYSKKNGDVTFTLKRLDIESKIEISNSSVENIVDTIETAIMIGTIINPVNLNKAAEQTIPLLKTKDVKMEIITLNSGRLRSWAVTVSLMNNKNAIIFTLLPSRLGNFNEILNQRHDAFYIKTLEKLTP